MTDDGSPTHAEALAALLARVNAAQGEDIARRYVAGHIDDADGWRLLLRAVDQNGQVDELARLSLQASRRFRDERTFRNVHFIALVRQGRHDAAREGLRTQARCGIPLLHDEAVLLGHLELAVDPDAALRVFAALAHSAPGAMASLAHRAALSSRRPSAESDCIALLVSSPWHAHLLGSVADALAAARTPHVIVSQPWLLPLHRPVAVVVADPVPLLMREVRAFAPGAPVVNVGHGLYGTGKPYGLYAAANCDYVVESSPTLAAEIARDALLPAERVWPVGLPQTDALFRRLADGALPAPARPTVLFAPTFTPGLSAAERIGDDPVHALRGDDDAIRVLLTAHPNLNGQAPSLLARWRTHAERAPLVDFVDSQAEDISLRLPETSVLVTDVSSVALQFLPLDRPVVQLFDPAAAAATGAWYARHDRVSPLASACVADSRDLAAAVRRALSAADDGARTARRTECARLFGALTDGRAGERIAARLDALRQRGGKLQSWRYGGQQADG